MSFNIQQPAIPNADDKWAASEHLGNLLLFFPTEVRRGLPTSNGEADAVACSRVANLDTGRILHNTLIFGKALVPNVGGGAPDGIVLGRLVQGEGKPGQSKPWILLPHDENELRRAQDWLAKDAAGQLTQPTAPPTQSAPAPAWGQQAPVAAPAAPATGGWGNAPTAAPAPAWGAAPAPAAPAAAGWGVPAPVAAPPTFDELIASGGPAAVMEALRKKGVPGDQVTSPEQAAQIWAVVQGQPDVA